MAMTVLESKFLKDLKNKVDNIKVGEKVTIPYARVNDKDSDGKVTIEMLELGNIKLTPSGLSMRSLLYTIFKNDPNNEFKPTFNLDPLIITDQEFNEKYDITFAR